MRIGMMTDVYKPHISGITNYISLNKRFLEKEGHQVFIFTFSDEDYQDDESNVIRSPGLPLLDTGYFFNINYRREARALLRTMDVVHVHHPFLSGSLALRYCRPRGIPIVFTNHTRYDLYAKAYLPGIPETISETALAAYLPSFCRACNMVISPSPSVKTILQNIGVTVPIEIVPNGVDLQPFEAKIEPLNRASMGFSENDILLVYTGRLSPEKNLSFLIRSFAGVAKAYKNLGLLLVGDGPERDNLTDLVDHLGMSSKVKFFGMVPYEDIRRYLATGDIYATASITEVHPLSVIEAMAVGLPVLGIKSPGVGDIVQDGVNGYLAEDEDLAAFTAIMVKMVTEHEVRRQMKKSARERAESYSIIKTSKMMIEKYQEVINQSLEKRRSFRIRLRRILDKWER
ncbi:MAG: glycosyltransferase family 4 protein [Chloroflexi bacterium]|nr:glycosyltransferase family 4 protein [Chloroflexota bacterium]